MYKFRSGYPLIRTNLCSCIPVFSRKSLFVLFLLLSFQVTAQTDYYRCENMVKSGISLIDDTGRGNYDFCAERIGGKIVYHTPDEIIEYGLKSGKVYISMEIEFQNEFRKVFMERLVNGKTRLYEYDLEFVGKLYFVENDSLGMSMLPFSYEEGIRACLIKYTDNSIEIEEAIRRMYINRRNLIKVIRAYNGKVAGLPLP